jgi:hypothetical protein
MNMIGNGVNMIGIRDGNTVTRSVMGVEGVGPKPELLKRVKWGEV